MRVSTHLQKKPEILAPAGNRESFFAAVAAGADAIYCGLKLFSARMGAKNFTLEELGQLIQLAHQHDTRVYVAFNSLLKANELDQAGRYLEQLINGVHPDALIVQDLGLLQLVRQLGFPGEIHLSTLANVSFTQALDIIDSRLKVHRIVLPRECNIDEIKLLARHCPESLGLEVFVHGALCYGVSGRCYWSSYLGGKSGLRGRCVQPCRRRYRQQEQTQRFFSCQDLSLDVLVKTLLSIPQVRAWKIEGRKKGPHYVHHTVKAYQMLRDLKNGSANKRPVKSAALALLAQALGRSGTHYQFLPQRPQSPINTQLHSGSGMFIGLVQGSTSRPFIRPNIELLAGDVLRVGYEDETWHTVIPIRKTVPRKGRFYLTGFLKSKPHAKTPVFLTDRRLPALTESIARVKAELDSIDIPLIKPPVRRVTLPAAKKLKTTIVDEFVFREVKGQKRKGRVGCWVTDMASIGRSKYPHNSLTWWLPPVVWPDNEREIRQAVDRLLASGARRFVLNSPWQVSFFSDNGRLDLWAGPFCNIGNQMAIEALVEFKIRGVIISPEMGQREILTLPSKSPLPLGIVLHGSWPLCISRTLPPQLAVQQPFASPKGEPGWATQFGPDFWIFPGWRLDLKCYKKALVQAGYRRFIHLNEPIPNQVRIKERQGFWNWDIGLK